MLFFAEKRNKSGREKEESELSSDIITLSNQKKKMLVRSSLVFFVVICGYLYVTGLKKTFFVDIYTPVR